LAASDGNGRACTAVDYHERLDADCRALLEHARRSVGPSPKNPPGNGEAPVNEDDVENTYSFPTLNATVRA